MESGADTLTNLLKYFQEYDTLTYKYSEDL